MIIGIVRCAEARDQGCLADYERRHSRQPRAQNVNNVLPSFLAVLMTRTAISPRLATRILLKRRPEVPASRVGPLVLKAKAHAGVALCTPVPE